MSEMGLVPGAREAAQEPDDGDAAAGPIPDLLGRDFTASVPGDIAQIDTDEGALFLTTVIDCFPKSVIGWSIDTRYPASPSN